MKIEILPITVNIICTVYYIFEGGEPGKALYWLGATILALGLYKMQG